MRSSPRLLESAHQRALAFNPVLANAPFMMLEHVNLNIADRELGQQFYIAALGAGEDTRTDEVLKRVPGATGLLWANLGLQQFHLPVDEEAQLLRGEIHIDYPSMESLQELEVRLQAAESTLAGTQFEWRQEGDGLRVRCPWGNTFVLAAQKLGSGWYSPEGTVTSETVSGHPCIHAPIGLGIREVHFHVAKGSTAGIGRFYRKFFETTVEMSDLGAGLSACSIQMGFHQRLRFVEIEGDVPDYDGHHICVYVSSFEESYTRFKEHDLLYKVDGLYHNPRFPSLSYETLERAQELNEFRILNIVDPESPDTLLTQLEHEIRHPLHSGFPLKEMVSELEHARDEN